MDTSRRSFIKKTATGLAASAAANFYPRAIAEVTSELCIPRPNVLWINIEDLSAARLGCYGHTVVKSPHIDSFAQEAVRFEDCHCQVPICTASRLSILTGTRPETSGILRLKYPEGWQSILPDIVSLPRHFRDNGYVTQSVGKSFDPRGGPDDDAWTYGGGKFGISEESSALAALNERAEDGRPFFLSIGFAQCHNQWTPSQESMNLYNFDDIQPESDGLHFVSAKRAKAFGASSQNITVEEARQLCHKGFATISDVDRMIGNILATARDLDLFDNTIIIVWTGDHGLSWGENNIWGKIECYSMCTRVPLLIRVPDNPNNGRSVPAMVECIDMYPTLVDLCKLPQPPQILEATTMAPLLNNPDLPWKEAAFTTKALSDSSRSVKTKDYTLIARNSGRMELYDRINDPKETTNIAQAQPDVLAWTQSLLNQGWESMQLCPNTLRRLQLRLPERVFL